jgi:AcrR family transcriptional regulator
LPRRAYHHGNLRAELVRAAIALLEREGVTGIRLREVARRAGVSHAAPYNHFADREALLAAAATEGFARLDAALAAAARRAGDPRARLRALARAYLDFALGNPALYRLMLGSEIRDRDAHPELLAADAAVAQRARDLTAACLALSARRPIENETASVAAWALVHGLADLLIDGRVRLPSGRAPDAAFRDEVAALFLTALVPEDALP